jgi:ectoine hydroxylase-related dioxygenase (phytanoyl-CoA dioxygenase family)
MAAQNILDRVSQITRQGFCILPDMIPPDRIDAIRIEVVAAQREQHALAEAEFEKTRARGHRVGAKGVASLRQVVNATQCFVEYLADPRILRIADSFFGDYVRISCTDCAINQPGNERGYWHADWPYNATNSTHVRPPYPSTIMHLSTIWMLTPFTRENGGTFIMPGSHLRDNNPGAGKMEGVDRDAPLPGETQVRGEAGSVLLYDSRLWHAVAPNRSSTNRVALIVRYAPWWLNLTPTMKGTPDHERMVSDTGGKNYDAIPIRREVFDALPERIKPLFRHWVRDE